MAETVPEPGKWPPVARALERLSAGRRAHVARVAAWMAAWAARSGQDPEAAALAAWAHDLAREWAPAALLAEAARLGWQPDAWETEAPVLLHGPVAAAWLQEWGLGGPAVQEAVRFHTTAAPGVGLLAQALYVADAVEPGRRYSGRGALERLALHDLGQGYRAVLEASAAFYRRRGVRLHPRTLAALAAAGEAEGGRETIERTQRAVRPAGDAAEEWAQLAAATALRHKGEDVRILDMRPVTLVADFFVIVSGRTALQVAALADHIEEALDAAGAHKLARSGQGRAEWVLLDYGSVVVHIFTEAERRYYDLERLWGDAPRLEVAEEPETRN
ncbi:ribosomal silencing factor (modular protein) [Candidatus Hydrogenisulfobacillus filiaventi]|uniref:Ribosomal silencing factor RsfS n=1 Tax=Candidatus Hydrogenisulfobacillus filiaventi TaxID=2707344 RepID=A0A6F8ZJ24_9FIRM|nr:ribosome silencing factor [Bacillota bacterium]CAB1129664.1 ribosomal silencing factor (modular protein) [Candidatus Hydrogenisulfobacillus filiaventi]